MGIVKESEIHQMFLTLYHKLLEHQDHILKSMLTQLDELQNKAAHTQRDADEQNRKIAELIQRNHTLARLQTKGIIDSADFVKRCSQNNQEIAALQAALRKQRQPDRIGIIIQNTKSLLEFFEKASPLPEFDPQAFARIMDRMTLYPQKVVFHLKNGLMLEEERKTE